MSACPPGPPRARSGAPRGDDTRGGASRLASRRNSARGVSWVSLLLLLSVAGSGYLAWIWAPVYFTHYEVKQIARDYMNQAVKDPQDEALVARMVERLGRVDVVAAVGADGERELRPLVVVDPRDVRWERDASTSPPILRVSFAYEREVRYPLLDRTATKILMVDLENELAPAEWGRLR